MYQQCFLGNDVNHWRPAIYVIGCASRNRFRSICGAGTCRASRISSSAAARWRWLYELFMSATVILLLSEGPGVMDRDIFQKLKRKYAVYGRSVWIPGPSADMTKCLSTMAVRRVSGDGFLFAAPSSYIRTYHALVNYRAVCSTSGLTP